MKTNFKKSAAHSHRTSRSSSKIKPVLVKRILVWGALSLILAAAQCSFFAPLAPFGATPDLLLGMLAAIMLLDSFGAAAVCALFAGYSVDAIGAVPPSFSPIYYIICIGLLALMAEKMLPRFLSFGALLLTSLAGRAAFTFINILMADGALPSFSFIAAAILSEALATFVFCLPLYIIVKPLASFVGARKKFEFN